MLNKKDLRQIDYVEWGKMLNILTNKLTKFTLDKEIKFDLIVPILRSGAFTGLHIASKLNITNILPVQYKYIYKPVERIEKKFDAPLLKTLDYTSVKNILITDSNTVTGGILELVIKDMRNIFPKANLYFATAKLDVSYKKPSEINEIFYSTLCNQARSLNSDQAAEAGLDNEIIIFPWEVLEEEWQDMQV